ncbi:assimilatory nitrate reductase catalytic subunit [Pantoea alhagi]|uniref:nitrate reductase n=1 Tax=Mixta sp. BE291 TaxID=3158787 RepID=UPI002856A06F|nr:assimilatory nitrate reductase catalytic subunit [Pantoea alhagi]
MKTTCPYCGVGCGVQVSAGAQGWHISGDVEHPANAGRLCVKGAALGETLTPAGRLLWPQIAGRRVSWQTALDSVAERLQAIIQQHGPDAVAFYASGQLLTEDYYVANKLMKGFIGSGNIDTNSRLCMASAVTGYKRALGADAVPCCYEDFTLAEVVVLVGSNAAWTHPVAYQRLVQAKQQNPALRIVVIDPRRSASCDLADLHLPLAPGSDGALFNGLLRWLAAGGYGDDTMLPHLTQVAETLATADHWTPERVAQLCQLPQPQVEQFYRLFAGQSRVLTLWCMGINQSSSGSDKCNAILNAHLFSGKIGLPGSGAFSLTGQPNAMGGREVGGLANQLAAHMDFTAENIDRLQRFWQSERVAAQPGLKAVELFQAIGRGEVKAVWIMGTNPAVSLPDGNAVAQALQRCELVIVSEVVRATDTSAFADILLPAQAWGEKNGTVTNSERRISRQRAFTPPQGEARPDWWMLAQVAQRLGYGAAFGWQHPAEIFREHAALSGFENHGRRAFDISGLAQLSNRAWDTLQPIQWPVNAAFPQGCARLFGQRRFYHADGKARLVPVTPAGPRVAATPRWPLMMNTGRIRDQWHTMTRTGLVPRLLQHVSEPFVALHPDDALRHNIWPDALVRIQSRHGWMIARASLTEDQTPGTLFVPMHWNQQFCAEGNVDRLVAPWRCAHSGQPESKQTPVSIQPWHSDWQGTLFIRDNVTIAPSRWWCRVPMTAELSRFSLAHQGDPRHWLQAQLRPEWTLQQAGDEQAFYHLIAWHLGEVMLAFYTAARRPVIDDALIASAFQQPPVSAAARFALLAGRATQEEARGKTICSCFGIGEQQIIAAIRQGALSCAALGKQLKCGTNCGSCIPELKKLIQQHAPQQSEAVSGRSA